jgi:adenylate cyclase
MGESTITAPSPPTGFISRLAAAAINVNDDEVMRLRKTVLLLASGLMNISAILWLAIYWSMGLKLPSTIPFTFQILSAVVVFIFLRTQNFAFFRFVQLALFLFFPFV